MPLMVPADAEISEGLFRRLPQAKHFGRSRPHQSEKYNLHGSHRDHAAQKARLPPLDHQTRYDTGGVERDQENGLQAALISDHLKNTLGISCVTRVMLHEPLTARRKS